MKSAVIFGPNASGKTNLLSALCIMRDLVVNSTSMSGAQFAELYDPFRLDDTAGAATHFDIEVLLAGVRYEYSFAYDARHIVREGLRVFCGRKPQRWFERRRCADGLTDEWLPFSASLQGPREMWRKATRSSALFLSTAAKLNAGQFQPLLHWFEHQVDVVLSSEAGDLAAFTARLRDPHFKCRVLEVLRAIDIRVDDMRIVDGGTRTRPTLQFLHGHRGGQPAWIELSEEGSGVRRLVALLGPLLRAIDEGKLVAIDEFDSHLHPLVARFLIQLFNDPVISSRQAQLLLSSHNMALMDLDLLRRDEIWLMNLEGGNSSRLSALSQVAVRKHEAVAKGYLKGRFGAIPGIRTGGPAQAAAVMAECPDE